MLQAPEISFSLTFFRRADEAGYTAVFEYGECKLVDRASREVIGRVPECDGLYQVVTTLCADRAVTATSHPSDASELELSSMELHRLLGHVSLEAARDLIVHGRATGVKLTDDSIDEACDICIHSKITRRAIPHQVKHDGNLEHAGVEAYSDRIDADLWAPGPQSLGRNAHSAVYANHATRYEERAVFKAKDGADGAFRELEATLRTQYNIQTKWLHSDGGGKFVSLQPYLRERGIHSTMTVYDMPEQNNMAERSNRVHRERVSTMLRDANLPPSLWSYAFLHSVYLRNRTGNSALCGKTPCEARF